MNVMEETLRNRIDPALTPAALSEIGSRALGHPVTARSSSVLTGGCLNRVVGVVFEEERRELVFKISPKPGTQEIEREAAVLEFFARNTQMPVPRPLLVDTSCRLIPGSVLVMERLDGVVLHRAWGRMGEDDRHRVAREISLEIKRLHRARTTGFGGVELSPASRHRSWPEFWIPRFHATLEEARRLSHLCGAILERAEELSSSFPNLLDIGEESVLTHYDIWSGNILVRTGPEGVSVSGYLDPPGYWADRAREISFMEMFGLHEVATSPIYRGEHIPDDTFELRKAAYNLKMNIRHVSMYPGEVAYRDGVLDCLTTLERAL